MTFPIIFIQKILIEVCLEKSRSAISNENGARYRFAYDVLDRLIAESGQQTYYFHCDQIGIQREMTDKDGNLLWFGNYTGWGCLKEETKVTDSSNHPFRLQNQYADCKTSCTTTSSGIMNLSAEDLSIRIRLGCFVGSICINLLLALKCGLIHLD